MECIAEAALLHISSQSFLIPTSRLLPPFKFSDISPFGKSNKFSSSSGSRAAVTCHMSKWTERLLGDFNFTPTTADSSSSPYSAAIDVPPGLGLFSATDERTLPLPIDFYQVLGAEKHFLADGIRRAYEAKVSNPIQCGFSHGALIGRLQILQAACETLSNPSSRGDYNRGLTEDPDSTLTTHVPWDKVPGALCVLQEAGEVVTVLQVGGSLLHEWLPKPFKQDVVLAMTLAFVDLSRDAMALIPPDFLGCCEVLERALKLLQEEGASNLASDLLGQIDDTLEEIGPRCTIELLALPLDEEHLIKRQEGLHSIRSILWTVGKGGSATIGGGYTRERFMNEAFVHMTASEQVLDGRMLKIWSDHAAEAAQQGCFWEYTVQDLTIDSVIVSLDGRRAVVEATIHEAAKSTDIACPGHNGSCSTAHTVRYTMAGSGSGWKITEGAILKT